MKHKTAPAGGSRLSPHVIASVFATLIPFVSVSLNSSHAAVATSITPTAVTGNLGTTVTLNGNVYNIATSGGGIVSIDLQFVLLQNSQILAQVVRGADGNIFITTNLLAFAVDWSAGCTS